MSEDASEKDENPDAEAVFNQTLKNLLATPHKPHKPEGKERLTDSGNSKGKGRS